MDIQALVLLDIDIFFMLLYVCTDMTCFSFFYCNQKIFSIHYPPLEPCQSCAVRSEGAVHDTHEWVHRSKPSRFSVHKSHSYIQFCNNSYLRSRCPNASTGSAKDQSKYARPSYQIISIYNYSVSIFHPSSLASSFVLYL